MIDPSTLVGLNSITVNFSLVKGSSTDHDIIIYEEAYRFNGDYACDGAELEDGTCTTDKYIPSRTTNAFVVASNRAAASNLGSYSKTISNLAVKLDPTKKYLLNIRAYTASKSLSSVTTYKYTMTSNLGTLCPE